jgi:hypothetical protein
LDRISDVSFPTQSKIGNPKSAIPHLAAPA